MGEPETFRLRVILPEDGIERVTLERRPDSIPQLTSLLREKLEIPLNFLIQFEDPEFNNQLVNLSTIEEIPNMGTAKLVKIIEHDISSTSSWASDSGESSSCQTPQRSSAWPKVFSVPTFSHDIEFLLSEANSAKQKYGRHLTLTKEQKSKILDGMSCAVYKYKAYPSSREISQAAEALVQKHPCLEETGSKNGWDGWNDSLANKMNNYRRKLCKSRCPEVKVNSGRRSKANPDAASPHASIKWPRRAEVNYLPQLPQGETLDTLEVLRVDMLMEMEKDSIDFSVIDTNMSKTFSARRFEIVNSSPSVASVKQRWPALFLEHQVYAEYQCIRNQPLRVELYAALDQHTDRLLALASEMQGKSGRGAQRMSSLLKAYSQQTQDVNVNRIAALRCLPVLLQEDDAELFYTCKEGAEDGPAIKRSAAIVSIIDDTEDVNTVPFHPCEVKVFLQDQVVLQGTECWPDALLYLYGLLYVLQVEYPKSMTYTFEFIQKVLLNVDGEKLKNPRHFHLRTSCFRNLQIY